MKTLQKIDTGIFADVHEDRVYHLTIPAYGFTPAMKKTDYMACGFNEDGSIRPVVVGVSLAKAKSLIKAWGTPLDPFKTIKEVKEAFGVEAVHPAYEAILKLNTGSQDVVHRDRDMIERYPKAQFIFAYRDGGSHLIPMTEGPAGEADTEIVGNLLTVNDQYYFWNGKSLRKTSRAALMKKLKTIHPLGY